MAGRSSSIQQKIVTWDRGGEHTVGGEDVVVVSRKTVLLSLFSFHSCTFSPENRIRWLAPRSVWRGSFQLCCISLLLLNLGELLWMWFLSKNRTLFYCIFLSTTLRHEYCCCLRLRWLTSKHSHIDLIRGRHKRPSLEVVKIWGLCTRQFATRCEI